MKDKLPSYTRRGFLGLGLGLAAGAPLALSSGCGSDSQHSTPPPPPPRADAKVAIVSCQSYGSPVQDSLNQAFTLLGGIGGLVNGKTVTVKVNLTCDGSFGYQFGKAPGESYITHGATAIALASLLLSSGAQKVRFAGPGQCRSREHAQPGNGKPVCASDRAGWRTSLLLF